MRLTPEVAKIFSFKNFCHKNGSIDAQKVRYNDRKKERKKMKESKKKNRKIDK